MNYYKVVVGNRVVIRASKHEYSWAAVNSNVDALYLHAKFFKSRVWAERHAESWSIQRLVVARTEPISAEEYRSLRKAESQRVLEWRGKMRDS